ncbi:MAG: hypothetical protein PF795_09190 [Kiritimatiellae bacterium]|jgi:rhamnogalacturonan endolyase|nr:hypothetical protein [Kiritimatiellia bacterium]
MKNKTTLLTLFTAFFLCMTPRAGIAQPIEGWAASRVHEALDRGLLVQSLDDNAGVYINWRQLKEDGPDPSYNVYVDRAGVPESYELLNTTAPITQTTDVVDPVGDLGDFYYVETINTGSISNAFSAYDTPYISIDVGGSFEKVGVGDLNGDGVMDFVIRTPAGSIDPNGDNWHDSTHTLKLKAFDGYTGAHMWTYDLGWNIEAGVWYSPFIVYDFDGNGKAEVAAKTGLTPQDDGANYVDYRDNQNGGTGQGRVDNPNGPEFLSIIDGETGNIVQRQPWPNREGLVKYNWRSRNQIAVAYLDGKTPFIIAQRGTYGVLKVQAYTFHNNQLTMDPSWYWDSTHEYPNLTLSQVNEGPGGQWIKLGAHSIRVGDVDGDDREEIILGACVLNDDLTGLWAKPSRYDQIDHT